MAYLKKRSYTVKLPDGTTEKRKTKHYSIRVTENGRRSWVKGFVDRGATLQLAAQLERDKARGETGMVNPHKEQLVRPIDEQLAEFIDDLKASGRGDKYRENMKNRCKLVIAGTGWKTLRDVDASGFISWRTKARSKPREGTVGRAGGAVMSARTVNHYLENFRAFTNWCATSHRMPGVPIGNGKIMSTALSGISKVDGPVVRKRRALTDTQVTELLSVAPADRAIVYRLAMATGLRRGEIGSLCWSDLRLDVAKPYAAPKAEDTKAGRPDRIAIPATLAAALVAHKPAKATERAKVFPKGVPTIEIWRVDLKAAGIEYRDANGRQADFHGGTRKTLCTRMHRAGIPLATAMRSMRHTDSRLTMVDYTDDDQLGVDEATADMPELLPAEKESK